MNAFLEQPKGWLNGYVAPKKREYQFNTDCILFIPLRCPKCRSKKITFANKDGRLRYHTCECGHKFKSIEQDN